MKDQPTPKICENGHEFYHSSRCLVCPFCWRETHLKEGGRDFDNIGAPAQRALFFNGYRTLDDLSRISEKEIASLHGMGPKGIRILKERMAAKGLSFLENK